MRIPIGRGRSFNLGTFVLSYFKIYRIQCISVAMDSALASLRGNLLFGRYENGREVTGGGGWGGGWRKSHPLAPGSWTLQFSLFTGSEESWEGEAGFASKDGFSDTPPISYKTQRQSLDLLSYITFHFILVQPTTPHDQ